MSDWIDLFQGRTFSMCFTINLFFFFGSGGGLLFFEILVAYWVFVILTTVGR